MAGQNILLKMLNPFLEKELTDEKVTNIFSQYINKFPIEKGEIKNVILISKERDDKIYYSVWSLSKNENVYFLKENKQRGKLVDSIKNILKFFNEKNNSNGK
ncbi:MAG TPA: hypothetical protein PK495_07535 [Bacteroidales bacterium]|nr:hypothetical protein [Bacteroidales bacterium]HQB20413.1 hypothetical protein [Bacteroidales bacterium]